MEYTKWLKFCFIILVCTFKVQAQCSGSPEVINLSTFVKGSRTYPASGEYTENLNCAWTLTASNVATEDVLVYLSINKLRANDILTVYNGENSMGTSLHTTNSAGTSSQSVTVVATSGKAHITFVSDAVADTNQYGFTFRYLSASTNDGGGCSSAASLTATDTTQYVTSQNFPSKYEMNSDCNWSITTQDSCGSITLTIIYSDIEADCSADKVTLTYDGSPQDLCTAHNWNTSPDPTHSTTGTTASIRLTSDGSDEFHGFVMSYSRTGCATTTTTAAATTTNAGNGASPGESKPSEEGDNAGVIAGATVAAVVGTAAISAGAVVLLKAKGFIGTQTITSSAGGKPALTKTGPSEVQGNGPKANHIESGNGDVFNPAENADVSHMAAPQSTAIL